MLEGLMTKVWALLLEVSLKSLLVLAVAGLVLLCLRRASAAVDHLVLLVTLGALLLLPLFSATLPGWRITSWPQVAAAAPPVADPGVTPPATVPADEAMPPLSAPFATSATQKDIVRLPVQSSQPSFPWPLFGVVVWAIGVCVVLVRVSAGLVYVHRLERQSLPIATAAISELCAELARELGIQRAVTLRQAAAGAVWTVPMTWGWRRSVVLLPATVGDWPTERLRVVLLHELAHIRRGDWLWQMLAHGVCALYWFHPGVWMVARRLRMESERACDDEVLSAGVPAPDYAGHLLDVARTLAAARLSPSVAVPIVELSQIESRIRNMLSGKKEQKMVTARNVWVGIGAALCALLPLAALQPAGGSQESMAIDSKVPVKKPFIVVVDPGHGGQDTGAVGLDGTLEKHIDLAIALKLHDVLMNQGANVYLTRTGDTFVPLPARPALAKSTDARCFVSIHCGLADKESGTKLYYHGQSVAGRRCATNIADSLRQASALPPVTIHSDTEQFPMGYAVLRGSPVPAVLIECGFMNNAHDLAALRQTETQQRIADGIASGLEDFAATQTRALANAPVSADRTVLGRMDAYNLEAKGSKLTPIQAAQLARDLAANPDDLALRVETLGYYNQPALRYKSGNIRPGNTGRTAQILWLIRTHPTNVLLSMPDTMIFPKEDGAAYAEAKRLWLSYANIEPPNAEVLANGASFLTLSDFPASERLYLLAEAVEPKNPSWPAHLGYLYQLQESTSSGLRTDYRDWARKALAQYERLSASSPQTSHNDDVLAETAKAAYDAGVYDKAQACARRLLDLAVLDKENISNKFFGAGSAEIHQGNMILGRLALRDGDVAQAKACLLAMGNISGSASLNSFGPNMQLAQELLRHSERSVVLQYLGECAKFWKNDNGQLGQWRDAIESGQAPDFGGNLAY